MYSTYINPSRHLLPSPAASTQGLLRGPSLCGGLWKASQGSERLKGCILDLGQMSSSNRILKPIWGPKAWWRFLAESGLGRSSIFPSQVYHLQHKSKPAQTFHSSWRNISTLEVSDEVDKEQNTTLEDEQWDSSLPVITTELACIVWFYLMSWCEMNSEIQ